jgi:nucleoside-diphosphate-sugar epimerase
MAGGLSPGGLFCFGFGYCATALARRLQPKGWRIGATVRDESARRALVRDGIACLPFGDRNAIAAALGDYDHLLISIPPSETGDRVLTLYSQDLIARGRSFRWIAYLSTTGVYGDRGGGWVDETSEPRPSTDRGRRRLHAERAWLALHGEHALPIHIFRLAGIYGPGRNQLVALRKGEARRIVKPGQVFSRIHVDDVAGVLDASMARPHPGRCYNVCDDEPAPPQEVIAYAADILGLPVPAEIPFERAELTGLSRSFYDESKRVSNRRIKEELGYRLAYPSYREGLRALKASL